MLLSSLRCAIYVLTFAVLSPACCRRPTGSTVVGTWQQARSDAKNPVEIIFRADHTFSFKSPTIGGAGTWSIAGNEFIVIFVDPSRPGEDTMHTYTAPKICWNRLHFGPSREIARRDGQQMFESNTYEGDTVYQRVR